VNQEELTRELKSLREELPPEFFEKLDAELAVYRRRYRIIQAVSAVLIVLPWCWFGYLFFTRGVLYTAFMFGIYKYMGRSEKCERFVDALFRGLVRGWESLRGIAAALSAFVKRRPGSTLRPIGEFLVSRKTMKLVVEPLLVDMENWNTRKLCRRDAPCWRTRFEFDTP
jgi:hypothetical protein